MDDKEQRAQKALGLEKGFVIRLGIQIPVDLVSIPIVVTGVTEDEARQKVYKLSEDERRNIIVYLCQQTLEIDDLKEEYGEVGIDAIRILAEAKPEYIDPKKLNTNYVEIDKDESEDSVEGAVLSVEENWGIDTKDVKVIE